VCVYVLVCVIKYAQNISVLTVLKSSVTAILPVQYVIPQLFSLEPKHAVNWLTVGRSVNSISCAHYFTV